MRYPTKEVIRTEYAALVEIVRVVRAAETVEAKRLYDLYRKDFPEDHFYRIIRVLEKCNQVKLQDGMLIWNRNADRRTN